MFAIKIINAGIVELIKNRFDINIGPKKVIKDIIKHKVRVRACAPPAAILKEPYTTKEIATNFKIPSIRADRKKKTNKKEL